MYSVRVGAHDRRLKTFGTVLKGCIDRSDLFFVLNLVSEIAPVHNKVRNYCHQIRNGQKCHLDVYADDWLSDKHIVKALSIQVNGPQHVRYECDEKKLPHIA